MIHTTTSKRVRVSLLLCLAAGLAVAVLTASKPFKKPVATVNPKKALTKFAPTAERLKRGRYLVNNVAGCLKCHSDTDWKGTGLPRPGTEGGGGLIPEPNIPFKVYAPNITPDPKTGSGSWTDEHFERALRQGIGHDGRTLFPLMPYAFLRSLSDEDLASIVVYIRSLPPIRRSVPRIEIPAEVAMTLQPLPPLERPAPAVESRDPARQGEYLATVAHCGFCHTPLTPELRPQPGMDFAGGQPLHGPWGQVASPNITPDASGISYYEEDFFLKTIRTGRVGGVRGLKPIMPWREFSGMTDQDLKSIFAYLRTLQPVQHRVDNTEPPAFCKKCGFVHGFGDRN